MPQLPALRYSNALLDFSPLSNAIDSNRRNALMQRDSARADEQLQMQRERFDYTKQRNQKQDQRSEIEWYGKAANAIQNMPENDPRRAAAWQGVLRRHGGQGLSPQEMDPITGPAMMAAQAGMYLDPRDSQMKDAELANVRARTDQIKRNAEPDPVESYLLQRLQGMSRPGDPARAQVPPSQVIPQSFEGAPSQTGLIRVADQTEVAAPTPAPPSDMVDTPYGNMTRSEARQLGGTMLLSPKYAAAGRALLDSIGGDKSADPSGLAKPTINQLEEKTMNSANQLARVSDIKKRFNARFLQVPTRMQMLVNSWTAKAGGSLSAEQTRSLEEYAAFRSSSVNNLNTILKELSGAAVTPQEYERIQNDQPVAGTGIFDGDDPTSFVSKLNRTEKTLKSAVARYNFMRSKGLNFSKDQLDQFLALDDVPAAIDRRGEEIERDMKARNPKIDPMQLEKSVRGQLKREFGI